jgi:hypothetical protein
MGLGLEMLVLVAGMYGWPPGQEIMIMMKLAERRAGMMILPSSPVAWKVLRV